MKITKLRIEGNTVIGTGDHYPDQCVRESIKWMVEARKHFTLLELQHFIKQHTQENPGSRGFLCSVAQAILDGATIEATSSEYKTVMAIGGPKPDHKCVADD